MKDREKIAKNNITMTLRMIMKIATKTKTTTTTTTTMGITPDEMHDLLMNLTPNIYFSIQLVRQMCEIHLYCRRHQKTQVSQTLTISSVAIFYFLRVYPCEPESRGERVGDWMIVAR